MTWAGLIFIAMAGIRPSPAGCGIGTTITSHSPRVLCRMGEFAPAPVSPRDGKVNELILQ